MKTSIGAPGISWQQELITLRRDLHAHPELGYQEVRTAAIVAARLHQLGLEVHTGIAVTGVVALLHTGRPGPCVLLRADMDALPVQEENQTPWKSTVPGSMHACGHDCHTAVVLTVAALLVAKKAELRGTIKFVFQPAEEGLGGAKRMIEEGILEDDRYGPRAEFALGLHMWGTQPVGKVGLSSGNIMACGDAFSATITGQGGHGAMPHQTIDPIVAAAHVILGLQSVVARNINPLEPAVVSVGKMQSGSAFNIIPNEVHMEGTIRSYSEEVRRLLEERCRCLVEELPRAFGASGVFQHTRMFPAVHNDPQVTELVRQAAVAEVGAENTVPFRTLGSDDMAEFLCRIPGCYVWVGGHDVSRETAYPHHHPRFDVDDRAPVIAARVLVAAVRSCLLQPPR